MSETTRIVVTTPTENYFVAIGAGLLAQVGARVDALLRGGLAAGKQRLFVVSSPEVVRLWAARC